MRTWIRSPDHLGDGVMALPVVRALALHTEARLDGPVWTRDLYRGLGLQFGPPSDADVAVLLKPSFRAAWQARGVPRRIGLSWDGRWPLLTDAVVPGGHRVEEFASIAAQAGVVTEGPPHFETTSNDGIDVPGVDANSVLVLPGSASGATVRWTGFRELADALAGAGQEPVFAGGPLEESWLSEMAGPHRHLPTQSLPAFAWLATRAGAVVSNDSGLGHLAAAARRAAGVDAADVHIVCGSTDPDRTAAPGATHHAAGRGLVCWPCDRALCTRDLACLQTSVAGLLGMLQMESRAGEMDAGREEGDT